MTDQEEVFPRDPVRAAPGEGTVLVGALVVALVGRPIDDPVVDRLWPLVRDGGDADALVNAAVGLGVADVAASSRDATARLVVRGAIRSEIGTPACASGGSGQPGSSGAGAPTGVWLRLPATGADAGLPADAAEDLTLALDRGFASAGAVHLVAPAPAVAPSGDVDDEVEVDTILHPEPPQPPPAEDDLLAPVAVVHPSVDDAPPPPAAVDDGEPDGDEPDGDTVLVPRPPPPPESGLELPLLPGPPVSPPLPGSPEPVAVPVGAGAPSADPAVAGVPDGEVDGDTVVLPPPPAPPPAPEEAIPSPIPVTAGSGAAAAAAPGAVAAAVGGVAPIPPAPDAGHDLWLPEARPAGLAPVITDVPRPAATAPDVVEGEDGTARSLSVYPLGADHDGTTVSAAQLRAIASRSPGAPPATAPTPSGSGHLAVQCPAAHLNPPHADRCRVCGSTVPIQAPFLVPSVDLGVLRFSTGLVKPLVRPLVIGRAPKLGGSFTGPVPELVTVPSPEQDVSRTHVEVRLEGWQVLAVDKGSTNGTTVTIPGHGTQRLRPDLPFPLPVGAVLSLADEVTISFEVTR